jgi:hypothetical protein
MAACARPGANPETVDWLEQEYAMRVFAAGDPVSFSDPYGRKVCLTGPAAEIGELRSALEGATGANISLDKQNCVSSVGSSSDRSLKGLRDRLDRLRRDRGTYTLGFAFTAEPVGGTLCENSGSHFCQEDMHTMIDQNDIRYRDAAASYFSCSIVGRTGAGPRVGHSGETIVAHEFLGHAWAYAVGPGTYDEKISIGAENNFRRRGNGGTARCGG